MTPRVHHSTTASTFIRVAVGCALTVSLALGAGVFAATGASAAQKQPIRAAIEKALKSYETCLAKHGVKLPKRSGTGRFGGSGTPPSFSGGTPPAGGFTGQRPSGGFFGGGSGGNSKFAKAAKACRSKLPKGVGGFPFGGGRGGTFNPTPAQKAALTKFEQCMSAHGVQIASNATFQTIRSLMQADPTAARACQSDLSGVFGRPGGTPGSPPTTTG